MTQRAVLYARVSGDDRQNSTSSLEGQIEQCREYAHKKGWQIVTELSEDERGASGASWDLPQLNKALELARAGQFDVLVTRELDRLARSLAKQLVFETEFNRLGVKVEYVIGDYQDSLEGKLNKQIRAVIAEYERLKINERMVRGRRRKAQSGYVVLHGNVPYGYKAVHTEEGVILVIDETTGEIVRMIFELYTVKGWGTPKIAKELNRLGIPTPSVARNTKTRRGNRWNQAQIIRFLSNETYAGKWRYGKRNRQEKHPEDYQIVVNVPAIVSRETFEQAQKQRDANTIRSQRNTKREYLLQRRCICGDCQAHMIAFVKSYSSGEYPYYKCHARALRDTHYLYRQCNMRNTFRADYWDMRVWQEIREFLSNPHKLAKGIEQYQRKQDEINEPLVRRSSVIDELLEQKQQELHRLLDLYLSNQFDKDVLFERKQRLESVIASLEKERQDLKAQMSATLTQGQLAELQTFSKEIVAGLGEADEDFETRRRMLDYLGAKVTFLLEDGNEVALLLCDFGHKRRLVQSKKAISQSFSPQRGSESSASSHEGEGGNYSSFDTHSMGCNKN